ncbi:synaptotagmin-like protein 2 isoform X5 [Scyliorhinus canicula]|uniref:synaptotagmin-like protein 2 isoform X5 n=1 Tax=Scyliorhinus canicula TaxID=7830 RepID=UPI0018F4D9DE|nr:synaptotagmin-like protein 2 isoform X5 [Scyliorhinus canicula]
MKGAMDSHLDLSFLTEDEYQAVLKVIQRDSELKKRDGERIRTAEKSIQDEKRRKLITGRWFDEVKAKRYRNSLPGVDLIKTSIRRKKPITYEPTEKTESQQAHLSPSFPIPKLSQTTKYKDTSVSTDEASEEAPGEEEKIPARRKMKVKPVFQQDTQKKSLYDPWESSSDEPSSTEVGGRTEEKGQQRDTGPNTSSPITEPTSDWQKQTKNVHTHHPQSCQTPTGSDITTDLQIRCTSSVSRIPRRINSMGTSGDLGRTGELTAPNANIVGHGHINGQIPVVSSVESPTCEQTPDLMKQGSVAGSHCDRTQAYQAAELGGQRIASTDDNTLITRAQSNLDVTEETCKALEELEHRHLNGQGFATVSTVALPMSEKALNVPKPKRSVATHYKGAPSYQIPEASAKGKMATSNATRIPKWKSSSRESETLSTDKPESLATEPGPEGLPLIPANEAHKAPEKLDLSPTSRIPRPKIASEAAAETPKAPVEDLEPASRQLAGPTYGLSPVMRALARAKKSNAKSMDNLSSTMDRETITTSVIENEMKSDADDKAPAANLPTLEHTRVKELSKSVPLLVTESESDSASEVSFNVGWHRKSPSDASHSSDMASVSSVSGSIMSVYSGDFGSIDAQGSVQFALDYSEKNKEFQIYVSQCKDLAVVDEKKGRTDAYVKTYLLPDKARMGKRKTSVKRRNLNPLYNEILKYKIEKSVLLIQKLNLSVWHNDTLGRNSFLGEVEVDLASWDWSNRELNWYLLKSRCPAVGVGIDHRGEINLAIKYIPPSTLGAGDPPTGEVHIWMKNARDLPQLRSSGVDSFVKCYVLPDTSKKSYQKTRIVKKDTNPIYNHTIVYDGFRPEDLKEACVELTVWDHEKLTNHFLGGLRLGFGTGCSYGIPVEWMDSTEEEVALWHEMVFNPNEWIPGSLLLRPQLGGKKLK